MSDKDWRTPIMLHVDRDGVVSVVLNEDGECTTMGLCGHISDPATEGRIPPALAGAYRSAIARRASGIADLARLRREVALYQAARLGAAEVLETLLKAGVYLSDPACVYHLLSSLAATLRLPLGDLDLKVVNVDAKI